MLVDPATAVLLSHQHYATSVPIRDVHFEFSSRALALRLGTFPTRRPGDIPSLIDALAARAAARINSLHLLRQAAHVGWRDMIRLQLWRATDALLDFLGLGRFLIDLRRPAWTKSEILRPREPEAYPVIVAPVLMSAASGPGGGGALQRLDQLLAGLEPLKSEQIVQALPAINSHPELSATSVARRLLTALGLTWPDEVDHIAIHAAVLDVLKNRVHSRGWDLALEPVWSAASDQRIVTCIENTFDALAEVAEESIDPAPLEAYLGREVPLVLAVSRPATDQGAVVLAVYGTLATHIHRHGWTPGGLEFAYDAALAVLKTLCAKKWKADLEPGWNAAMGKYLPIAVVAGTISALVELVSQNNHVVTVIPFLEASMPNVLADRLARENDVETIRARVGNTWAISYFDTWMAAAQVIIGQSKATPKKNDPAPGVPPPAAPIVPPDPPGTLANPVDEKVLAAELARFRYWASLLTGADPRFQIIKDTEQVLEVELRDAGALVKLVVDPWHWQVVFFEDPISLISVWSGKTGYWIVETTKRKTETETETETETKFESHSAQVPARQGATGSIHWMKEDRYHLLTQAIREEILRDPRLQDVELLGMLRNSFLGWRLKPAMPAEIAGSPIRDAA